MLHLDSEQQVGCRVAGLGLVAGFRGWGLASGASQDDRLGGFFILLRCEWAYLRGACWITS